VSAVLIHIGNELFTAIDSEKVKVVVLITFVAGNYYHVGQLIK
jgi:hypothetical protein